VQYSSSIEVNASGLQPGSTVTHTDSALKNHYRYTYKVVSRSGWNIASADSNRISFNWESPLPPPKKLSLQVDEKRLTLNWQPVSSLSDGSRINFPVRYQVYRSEDGKDFSRIAEAVDGRSYSDEDLENGRKYFYRVRGVRTVEGTELIGEASEVIAGVPGNVSSLAPPLRFTVVAVDEGVKILWESTPQAGVTGYRIYRRQAGSKKFRLVGEVDKSSFSFTDQHLPAGDAILYYVVTAIDAAVPPKESVFSREVEFKR
jgi:fibronectin type 3 domain-containing protein